MSLVTLWALEESHCGRWQTSISKLGRYMVGTVSIYTKSTCAWTMCMDHICSCLYMKINNKTKGMTKAWEKEDIEQRETSGSMGKGSRVVFQGRGLIIDDLKIGNLTFNWRLGYKSSHWLSVFLILPQDFPHIYTITSLLWHASCFHHPERSSLLRLEDPFSRGPSSNYFRATCPSFHSLEQYSLGLGYCCKPSSIREPYFLLISL